MLWIRSVVCDDFIRLFVTILFMDNNWNECLWLLKRYIHKTVRFMWNSVVFYGILGLILMEQFKNVPSMFHQNLMCLKTEIPASAWLTGICFGGCQVELEPTTFRTTSKLSNCLDPMYLSAFQRFCILLLRQFCDEFSQSCNLHNFKFRNILFAWECLFPPF